MKHVGLPTKPSGLKMEGSSVPSPCSRPEKVLTPKWKNMACSRRWNTSCWCDGNGRRGNGGGGGVMTSPMAGVLLINSYRNVITNTISSPPNPKEFPPISITSFLISSWSSNSLSLLIQPHNKLTTQAAAAAAASLGGNNNNNCVHPVTTDCLLLLTCKSTGTVVTWWMILPVLSTSIGILLSEDFHELEWDILGFLLKVLRLLRSSSVVTCNGILGWWWWWWIIMVVMHTRLCDTTLASLLSLISFRLEEWGGSLDDVPPSSSSSAMIQS